MWGSGGPPGAEALQDAAAAPGHHGAFAAAAAAAAPGSQEPADSAAAEPAPGHATGSASLDDRGRRAGARTRRGTNFARISDEADRMHKERALSEVPMFRGCSSEFLAQLSAQVRELEVPAGRRIATEGTGGEALFICQSGCIAVETAAGTVGSLRRGDCFGETNFLGIDGVWQATLAAESHCLVFELRRSVLSIEGLGSEELQCLSGIRAVHSQRCFQRAGTLEHTISLFKDVSVTVLRAIQKQCVRRLFFPGQVFIEEGTRGTDLHIVVHGDVSVSVRGRVIGRLHATVWEAVSGAPDAEGSQEGTAFSFGASGLLGLDDRRASSVTAQSLCQVRVLQRSSFQAAAQAQTSASPRLTSETLGLSDADLLVARLTSGLQDADVPDLLRGVSFLRDAARPFLDFIASHVDGHVFLPGQNIFGRHCAAENCIYLLARGSVTVAASGQATTTLKKGTVFGEDNFLSAPWKQPEVVEAVEICFVRILRRDVVCCALERFPDERQGVLHALTQKTNQESHGAVHDLHEDTEMSFCKFCRSLHQSPFGGCAPEALLQELSKVAISRIYLPGDHVVVQGEIGESLYILASGRAAVLASSAEGGGAQRQAGACPSGSAGGILQGARRTGERVGALSRGGVFGQMVMLGVADVNTATVEAETLCTMWELPGKSAMPIVARFKGARDHFRGLVMGHLADTVAPRMSSLPVFCKLSHSIRGVLGSSAFCAQHVFFPGQAIAEEGQSGSSCMHVLNAGKAELTKKGVHIKTCAPGSCFGTAVMLRVGEGVYVGTLTAKSTCHVLSLSAVAFQQALAEQHPPEEGEQQLRTQARRREHDLLRSAKMMVWRVTKMASGDVVASCAKESSFLSTIARQAAWDAMFRQLFGAWQAHAAQCAAVRAQSTASRAKVERNIERWRRDRDAAVWKAELQRTWRRGELAAGCLSARAARGGFGEPPERRSGRPLLLYSPAATTSAGRGWRPGPARPEEAATSATAWASKVLLPQVDAGGPPQAWPAPRPSPHYSLRFPDVLTKMEEMLEVLAAAQDTPPAPDALPAGQQPKRERPPPGPGPPGSAQQTPGAPLPPLRPAGPGGAPRKPTTARERRGGPGGP